jgi:quinol monooxygenase YgiN
MIIKLFHVKVRPGKQEEFRKTLEVLSLPHIQSRNGMIACYPGQPTGNNPDKFVLVTVWKDEAVTRNRTPNDWARAVIPAESLPLLEEWHVDQYKSFGVLEQPLKPMFRSI